MTAPAITADDGGRDRNSTVWVSAARWVRSTLWLVVLVVVAACSSAGGDLVAAEGALAGAAASSDPAPGATATGAEPLTDAPGTLYVTTDSGDLLVVNPATTGVGVLWDAQLSGQFPVIEVAPIDRSTGLHALLSNPERQLESSLHRVTDGDLEPVANDSFGTLMVCLDGQSQATTSMAHVLGLSAEAGEGTAFAALPFDGSTALDQGAAAALERRSSVCPRWSSDRQSVATAAPVTTGDYTTLATHVDGALDVADLEIAGCAMTPSGFSPGDTVLLVAATCYGDRWADSGLYIVNLTTLPAGADLSDPAIRRLGSGNYGRSSWYPDGSWIAVSRSDAIEGQMPDSGLGEEPRDLVLIDVAAGSAITVVLPGGDAPHSLAWLVDSVHVEAN